VNIEIYVCTLHERNTHFQSFYYMHIVEIPINKGANSYKKSCESNVTDREKLEIGKFVRERISHTMFKTVYNWRILCREGSVFDNT